MHAHHLHETVLWMSHTVKHHGLCTVWDTYVPYCKEDERHAEDQRQHVAEGSKSEHS